MSNVFEEKEKNPDFVTFIFFYLQVAAENKILDCYCKQFFLSFSNNTESNNLLKKTKWEKA